MYRWFILLASVICSCDHQLDMPKSVDLHRRDTGVHVLIDVSSKARREIIHPDIKEIAVIEDYVVGRAESVEEVDGFATPAGYFIIDVDTGKTQEGLSFKELEIFLQKNAGIAKMPEFRKLRK